MQRCMRSSNSNSRRLISASADSEMLTREYMRFQVYISIYVCVYWTGLELFVADG